MRRGEANLDPIFPIHVSDAHGDTPNFFSILIVHHVHESSTLTCIFPNEMDDTEAVFYLSRGSR